MRHNQEKREISFRHIFDIAKYNPKQAVDMLNRIDVLPSDLSMLLGYVESPEYDVRKLAAEAAREISAEKLNVGVLKKHWKSGGQSAQNLINELAMKISGRRELGNLRKEVILSR